MDEATAVLVIIGAAILAFSFITIPILALVIWFSRRIGRFINRHRGRPDIEVYVVKAHVSQNGHRPMSKKE